MDDRFLHDEKPPLWPPTFALHPARGIVWACFWGLPLAAGAVMAINYSRIGMKAAAATTFGIAMIVTILFFGAMLASPAHVIDAIPGPIFWIPQLVIAYAIGNSLQGKQIHEHAAHGGSVSSAWPSVGIGVLCLPLVLAGVLGVAYLLEPPVIAFGDDEIYYSGEATAEDATRLAKHLQDLEFFGRGGASVQLKESSGRHTVAFVLIPNAWNEPETVAGFQSIGRGITEAGLFPAPLTIKLCDDAFGVQKTIVID